MKLTNQHYMRLAKQCHSITSELNPDVKYSIASFIGFMIFPCTCAVNMENSRALRKELLQKDDDFFKNIQNKAWKFL